jgi:hypothetical protein
MKKILTILIAVLVLASVTAAVDGSTSITRNTNQINNNTQATSAGPQILLSGNAQIGATVAVETGDNTFVGGNMVGSNYSEETGCESEEITMEINDSQTNDNTQTDSASWQVMVSRNVQAGLVGSLLTDDNTVVVGDMIGSSSTKTCITDGGDNGNGDRDNGNGDNGNGDNGNGDNGNGRPGYP